MSTRTYLTSNLNRDPERRITMAPGGIEIKAQPRCPVIAHVELTARPITVGWFKLS